MSADQTIMILLQNPDCMTLLIQTQKNYSDQHYRPYFFSFS